MGPSDLKPDERDEARERSYMPHLRSYASFIGPFWLTALLALTAVLFDVVLGHFAPDPAAPPLEGGDLRWRYVSITALLAAVGGLVAAPLVLIRISVNERQARTAEEQARLREEGLITDRITKAVEQLGAEKTVKKIRRMRTRATAMQPTAERRRRTTMTMPRTLG